MLFSERSLWTMLHGIGLGGGALLALTAVLSALYLMRPGRDSPTSSRDPSIPIAAAAAFAAVMVWLTTLVGTYVVFPSYRAAPPEGATDLGRYPRSMLLAEPATAWLHTFAMETKEHLPFVAGMLATAVAFVAWRYRRRFLDDRYIRRLGTAFLVVCFGIVAYVSLLGVFVNKVAPLE
ncbi:MAG TPA: hypothetical protein VMM18_00415 [Gemmatimonadaceae bacterium]|nr:hypothetical protein [Gemmatimonadaceae bacterium]